MADRPPHRLKSIYEAIFDDEAPEGQSTDPDYLSPTDNGLLSSQLPAQISVPDTQSSKDDTSSTSTVSSEPPENEQTVILHAQATEQQPHLSDREMIRTRSRERARSRDNELKTRLELYPNRPVPPPWDDLLRVRHRVDDNDSNSDSSEACIGRILNTRRPNATSSSRKRPRQSSSWRAGPRGLPRVADIGNEDIDDVRPHRRRRLSDPQTNDGNIGAAEDTQMNRNNIRARQGMQNNRNSVSTNDKSRRNDRRRPSNPHTNGDDIDTEEDSSISSNAASQVDWSNTSRAIRMRNRAARAAAREVAERSQDRGRSRQREPVRPRRLYIANSDSESDYDVENQNRDNYVAARRSPMHLVTENNTSTDTHTVDIILSSDSEDDDDPNLSACNPERESPPSWSESTSPGIPLNELTPPPSLDPRPWIPDAQDSETIADNFGRSNFDYVDRRGSLGRYWSSDGTPSADEENGVMTGITNLKAGGIGPMNSTGLIPREDVEIPGEIWEFDDYNSHAVSSLDAQDDETSGNLAIVPFESCSPQTERTNPESDEVSSNSSYRQQRRNLRNLSQTGRTDPQSDESRNNSSHQQQEQQRNVFRNLPPTRTTFDRDWIDRHALPGPCGFRNGRQTEIAPNVEAYPLTHQFLDIIISVNLLETTVTGQPLSKVDSYVRFSTRNSTSRYRVDLGDLVLRFGDWCTTTMRSTVEHLFSVGSQIDLFENVDEDRWLLTSSLSLPETTASTLVPWTRDRSLRVGDDLKPVSAPQNLLVRRISGHHDHPCQKLDWFPENSWGQGLSLSKGDVVLRFGIRSDYQAPVTFEGCVEAHVFVGDDAEVQSNSGYVYYGGEDVLVDNSHDIGFPPGFTTRARALPERNRL